MGRLCATGYFSRHFDLSGTASGSFHWHYVIRLSAAEYTAFGANLVRDGGALDLPQWGFGGLEPGVSAHLVTPGGHASR